MAKPLAPAFAAAVRDALSPDFLRIDAETLAEYGRDWTRVHTPDPAAVVLPVSTAEVSTFLRLANEHRVPVVPSGGRTGYAAGAVAASGEVVLSTSRMRRMDPVDTSGLTLRVQAGAVTQAVHEHVAPQGLTWPVDFASKGSSQIGGNIATNAGGVKVIRYGLTRQWVLGLQVVLAGGEVLELNGALEKNNTGVDLRQLFIGSEGILGVVTEATLKLSPKPGELSVLLFAVDGLAGVLALFRAVRRAPLVLSAFEFFTDKCLARLQRHRQKRAPFEQPASAYVLVEVEARDTAAVEAFVAEVFERGLAEDGVLAQSATQAQELWSLREGISESLAATGLPHKNDIALPVAALEAFCAELDSVFAARYPGFEVCVFGHIGDGNLHINIMKPDDMDKPAFLQQAKRADEDMFALVKQHGGSISAEHGIGLLKKDFLHYSRTPEEIALMRALKGVLDPRGILNPGKVI